MKAIAIITPKIDTFSNPTLNYLFEKLTEKGYRILFFAHEQLFIPTKIRPEITFCQIPFNFYKFNHGIKNYIKLVRQYLNLYNLLKIRNKVDKIICIDPFGIVLGGRMAKFINAELIYMSFEIFFEDEFIQDRKKIIKTLEMKYSEDADVLVIQDRKREELIKSVNKFSEDLRIFHIPVSPKPPEYEIEEYDIYSDLNIPKDKKIIVYSGSLMAWSGVNEFLNLIPEKLDKEYWLVLHSHYRLEENNELNIRIRELEKKKYNITFHNKAFYENADYYRFLSQCHIGIATYFPNKTDVFAGRNIEEIGLSSGKFSTYMMLGIPAVTTANTIYTELNKEYNFGETIRTADELPEAVSAIIKDNENKSTGCRKLYEKELNPVSRFEKFLEYIDA